MKSKVLLALNIGILLMATVIARKVEEQPLEEDNEDRFERQSDFNFPGPRRQNVDFESNTGRSRSRPREPPVFVDFGGDVPLQSDDSGSSDTSRFQEEERIPSRSYRPRHQQQSLSDDIGLSNANVGGKIGQQQELVEEEQKPEPDRLESLLKESKFSCSSKKPGYYADDGLSCEVFHYCNEGVRHSWMCPVGTNFHQIHLICMQEGGDNICKQSSKYYIVNDYLYKPIVDSTRQHNGTIRYADRYFPVDGEEEVDSNRGQAQSFRGQDGGRNQDGGGQRENDFRGDSDQQFFDPPLPPPRDSDSSSRDRFRPSSVEEESQFSPNVAPANPNFSSGSDDHGGSSFAPEEDTRVHFLPPQNRFRSGGGSGGGGGGRASSSRGLQFPLYDRESS